MAGWAKAEGDVIGERLVQLGMPEAELILERAATTTGESVRSVRARVAEVLDPGGAQRARHRQGVLDAPLPDDPATPLARAPHVGLSGQLFRHASGALG